MEHSAIREAIDTPEESTAQSSTDIEAVAVLQSEPRSTVVPHAT